MGKFLQAVQESELGEATREAAQDAFEAYDGALLYAKNEHNMSFDLGADENAALEPGWRQFLTELDRSSFLF